MRITRNTLENRIDYLNELTGSPNTAYTRDENGKYRANIGNYHLYSAYGGYTLHRMTNDGGGVTTPLGGGCVPARELYEKINSFIAGIQFNND